MSMIVKNAMALTVAAAGTVAGAERKSGRIVVWDERQPKQKQMYRDFLGNHIARYLRKEEGYPVRSVGLDEPEQGLRDALLDKCDVLIWWGHVRQDEISRETARKIVERVKAGRLALIVLHSAHWSTPFMVAMEERTKQDALGKLSVEERAKAEVEWIGKFERRAPKGDAKLTPSVSYDKGEEGKTVVKIVRPNCCFPEYAAHGKPSKMKTLVPDHPIAKGIRNEFIVSQTEMYGEPFHVPKPDAVVFEETWKAGQRFRSGAIWDLGRGKVFYFRPGHENFNVFHQPEPLKIVANATRWLAGEIQKNKARR